MSSKERGRPTGMGSPSGRSIREEENALAVRLAGIRRDFRIPFLLPHRVYAKALPAYDSFRILLRDMAELYADRGIDTRPLLRAAGRYDQWLIGLRRHFRRRRSLPAVWLAERFGNAVDDDELAAVLDNARLAGFARAVLREGAVLDYETLRLASS